MLKIAFTVEGEPIPKGRPRFTRQQGRRAYTPDRTKNYEMQVGFAAKAAMRGHRPTSLPVHVSIKAFFPIPKSAKKAEREAAAKEQLWHCGKCDSDNVFKSIADGVIGIVYDDDKQICEMACTKMYSDHPRVEVDVWELEGSSR